MDPSPNVRPLILLIPAWRPTEALAVLIEALQQQGTFRILVIDDGSESSYHPIFNRLEATGVVVRRHGINLGKGAPSRPASTSC